MTKLWFRWRRPDEGQGYGVASPHGLAVVIGFAVVTPLAVVAPPIIGHGSWPSFFLAALLACGCVAALVAIVRAHSDWNG